MHTTENNEAFSSYATKGVRGVAHVAGDKSISHRALMIGSQNIGITRIEGLLEGEDVLHTADALRACGVRIDRISTGLWEIYGVGVNGLSEPASILDMGNSGTGARLMMGLLAPYPFTSFFTGDASLCKRPMGRVITPLTHMGTQFTSRSGQRLPLAMQGNGSLLPIDYTLPVASAQVKTAILFAALGASGTTQITEREATRDHSERMLEFFGHAIEYHRPTNGSAVIKLRGNQQNLHYKDYALTIPADPSSAAFPAVAAIITSDSALTLPNVCINPLRTGIYETLREMGAHISYDNVRTFAGEPVADIYVESAALKGVTVPAARAPSMIDEYPILAIAAACAEGTTVMEGLGELRVKESNRFNAIIDGLKACGVECIAEGDIITIHGRGGKINGGATITTHFDHRIAMSFLIMGMITEQPVTVDDTRAIATSFPNFIPLMQSLGAKFSRPRNSTLSRRRLVIAVDGPAASGKGTLARRLADHYHLPYLDTGSLYRAAAMRLVYAGKEPTDVAAAIAAARYVQPHDLANPKLRQEHIGKAASIISAYPEVREALLEYQRNFARQAGGAVLDGRDIGTVVYPEASVKLFITASIETRAQRRHRELQGEGIEVVYESVLRDLRERDERDSKRSIAPLVAAADAVTIDTSELSANDVFTQTVALLETQRAA
jgi:3-phosphoshikimate 1-carboxyvinyltransferase